MPILDDLYKLITGGAGEADSVTRTQIKKVEPELSFKDSAVSFLDGVGNLAFGAPVNTYFSVITALDPELEEFAQSQINNASQVFGFEPRDLSVINKPLEKPRERVVGRTPLLTDKGLQIKEEKVSDTTPTFGDRFLRALGSPDQLYADARKQSETKLGAVLKTVGEMTVSPLTQGSPYLPDIPGVYDKERAKETQKEKLERLPERIAQASVLWSMLGGAALRAKPLISKLKPTKYGQKLIRQVEKDFDTLHRLAKAGIKATVKEGVEVYTPQGKGTIVSADPTQFKEVIVKLRDGTEKVYNPSQIRADPRSVMNATGMKPGRLLLDPFKLDPRLIESGAMTFEQLFDDVVKQGGPALAYKVGELMKDENGVPIMEAVGRAVAQGEAPEVDVIRISKVLDIPVDDAAELVATNFKKVGALIHDNATKLNKKNLAELLQVTGDVTPELRGQLHKTAQEIIDNPATLDRIMSGNSRYRRIKRGMMLSNPLGAIRDLLSSTTRTVIGAFEDLIGDTVIAGNEVAGRTIESIRKTGRDPRSFSDIYARSLSSFEAIGLGGGDLANKVVTNLKHFGDPEFDDWVRESTWAALRGEKPKPRPDKFKVDTNLDKIINLAEQFPDKFSDISKAISGDSNIRMLTLDQIAELRKSVKNLKNQPNLGTTAKAVIEGWTTAADAAVLMRTLGDVELRRVAIASRVMSFMRREGLTPEMLLQKLESTKDLDPFTIREFADAYEYGREVTFARKFEDTLVGQMLQVVSKIPFSEQIVGEFPYFNLNRIVYNWERHPARAGFGMLKDTSLGKLAGKIDEVQFDKELAGLGITDREGPQALMLRRDMKRRTQEAASNEYARFTSGMAMFAAATAFRYGKYAGPRWNEFDTLKTDPKTGERRIESVKLWEPYATVVALAEAAKAAEDGIPINRVFTPQELADLTFGVRNLEQNSVFAFTKIPEIIERESDPAGATGGVIVGLLDTEAGKFLSFMRRFKDLSALTDIKALGFAGEGELVLPDRRSTSTPNFVSSLPNDSWVRDLALPDFGEKGVDIYATDGILRRELSRAGLLYGSDFKTQPALMRFNGSIGFEPKDVLGQGFPDRKVDIRYSRIFNEVLQRTEDSPIAGVNNASAIVILANRAATLVANLPEPSITLDGREFKLEGSRAKIAQDVRRHVAKTAYESIRKEARQRAINATYKTEPWRLQSEFERQYNSELASPVIGNYLQQLKEQVESFNEQQ